MKQVNLTKEEIDDIFESAEHQSDYVNALFSAVMKKAGVDIEDVTSTNQFFYGGAEVCRYVMQKAIEWDRRKNSGLPVHKEFMPGGAWMNYGFTEKEDLEGWEVEFDPELFDYWI